MAGSDRFSLRNIYLYLVCLITLIISIFAATSLVRNVVELAYPDPGYYGYYPKDPSMTAEEQAQAERQARDSSKRQAVLGVVGSGTTLLIAGPLYLYHWRRIQAELPSKANPPAGAPPAP